MSDTNGRIDYGRLVSDIDFAGTFEGTRLEQYTSREDGLGSILGGWIGAIIGRFVGMALGEVAQELLIDELFGDDEAETDSEHADGEDTETKAEDSESNPDGETADSVESTDEPDEGTAEADAE